MIIEVTREYGVSSFAVTPLADDETPLCNARGAEVGTTWCDPARAWDTVGRLATSYGGGSDGDAAVLTIRYADHNSLTERIRRSREKSTLKS